VCVFVLFSVCLDVREQGSGLHVLFVEVAFNQTQTPYLTG
jgi:hypothetical protein